MADVLPGDGWHFEVKMKDGTVYDTPVVGWVRTADGGLAPCLVVPGELMAVSTLALDGNALLRRGIDDLRLYGSNIVRKRRMASENSAVMDPL